MFVLKHMHDAFLQVPKSACSGTISVAPTKAASTRAAPTSASSTSNRTWTSQVGVVQCDFMKRWHYLVFRATRTQTSSLTRISNVCTCDTCVGFDNIFHALIAMITSVSLEVRSQGWSRGTTICYSAFIIKNGTHISKRARPHSVAASSVTGMGQHLLRLCRRLRLASSIHLLRITGSLFLLDLCSGNAISR